MTPARSVVSGRVDTHGRTHHAAAIDQAGRVLGSTEFDATPAGYSQLLRWLGQFGDISSVGVEGTGTYGAGLCRYLMAHGVAVVEVDRPDRRARRQRGKSDPFLITAGNSPERLRSEAAFAHLCGSAPIPASSGRTQRHRLHRGGDRGANRSLHLAVVVRMRYCLRTRDYVERRTKDGLSKPEIRRCLKRYLAREVFHALVADLQALHAT